MGAANEVTSVAGVCGEGGGFVLIPSMWVLFAGVHVHHGDARFALDVATPHEAAEAALYVPHNLQQQVNEQVFSTFVTIIL